MSALRALKKLRAGAGQDMDDAERDTLVGDLKKARDKLKEGKLAKSEMIVKSCRQAGLHTMPESNGILDALLSKGSHKNMVRTVAYDPVSKQLKTCVTKDTYDAANEFIQKGGIEAFRSASGDLMSVLLDFNTVWNETEKLIQPYVVGTHYKKADALKNEEGKAIEVTGADGKPHPINSCEASATEQECYARRTSLAGKAGDACVWMPNFAHLDDQIVNSSVVTKGDWRDLQSKVCVHQGDMPLPMRDATQVDQTALRSGRQLKPDPNRAMGSSGRMLKLNAKAYEKPRRLPTKGSGGETKAEYTAIVPDNVFQLRYPQFSLVTPFGTTKKMPYVYKRDKGQNVAVTKITTTTDATGEKLSRLQKAVRARLLRKKDKLPQSVKNKLRKVQERSTEIRVATKEQLQHQYSDKRAFTKAVEEALEANPKYVSQTDQEDYAVYHLAKAGAFSQADVNALMSTAQNLGDRGTIAVATDDTNVAQAWTDLFKSTNSGLSSDELDLLKERLANPYGGDRRSGLSGSDSAQALPSDSGVKNSNDVYYATKKSDASKLGKLADFLSGGGDTSGKMLPVQMPPRHSAANDRMFVTFNHGPMDLFGGGLMTDSASGAHVGEDKAYPTDFKRIKAAEAKSGNITVPAASSTNPQLFFLTRYALLLLKADTAKYAPMLHNYYAGLRTKNTTNAAIGTIDLGDLDADTVAWMRAFGGLAAGAGFYGAGGVGGASDGEAAYNLFIKEKLDDADITVLTNTLGNAINLLLNSPAGAQRNAYDEANNNDFALNTTTGVKTRKTDTMQKYTYHFPVGLANIQLLEALSLRRAGADNDESLLMYLFGNTAYTKYEKAPAFIAWARKQFAKGNGAPVAMSKDGTKYDGSNADTATALPAFVAPNFEFPCEYANARALNALDKPGDYDTKKFKNDGAVGDSTDTGETMANIDSGEAAAKIATTPKASDRYAAYKQWAAYNKTQMQDIKTIAGLLPKHVALPKHRAQAFAVIKAVPFAKVQCPP